MELLSSCNDTLIVRRSSSVWMQRLKHDLTADKIEPNSLLRDRDVCHREREEGKYNQTKESSITIGEK